LPAFVEYRQIIKEVVIVKIYSFDKNEIQNLHLIHQRIDIHTCTNRSKNQCIAFIDTM